MIVKNFFLIIYDLVDIFSFLLCRQKKPNQRKAFSDNKISKIQNDFLKDIKLTLFEHRHLSKRNPFHIS